MTERATASSESVTGIRLRPPGIPDARAIHGIVCRSGTLDENSPYAYLLVCRDFADTSVVAEEGDALVGFVAGYTPPARPKTLFVWQVAVEPEQRGAGIASRMLCELAARLAPRGIDRMEATVTPSNVASRRLFERFAKGAEAELRTEPCFLASHFPDSPEPHEPEELLRIGPWETAA